MNEMKSNGRPEGVPESTRRRRTKGERMLRKNITLTAAELVEVEARARESGVSVSEVLVTSTLAPQSRLSQMEARRLFHELVVVRDAIGSLVVALRSVGGLDDDARARLREVDRQLFNATESLR